MRSLGYTTSLLLAASLAVAPACSKKDESITDAASKRDGEQGDNKIDDKEAADSVEAKPDASRLGATATKLAVGSGSSRIALIPDQAEFIIGFNLGPIMSSPFYKLAEGELNKDPEAKKMLAMVKDCGLDPQKLESVVVGIDQAEQLVLVMVGEGIGEDQKAKCLLDGVQTSAGEGPVGEVVSEGGKKSIELGMGRAYLVDGRTLAVASKAWDSALVSLIDGTGSPAVSNSKKDLFAKVNANAAMWGVATVPPDLASAAALFGAPAELATVKSITGSIDLGAGANININMLAVFGDEATAKSVATQLQAQLAEAGQDPKLAGLYKSMKIEPAGADVKFALSTTAETMAMLQALLSI